MQYRCPAAIQFCLGRFLRLVRRGRQDGHLRRGQSAQAVDPGDDGLHFVGYYSSAPSFHAAPDRGAVVANGIWERGKRVPRFRASAACDGFRRIHPSESANSGRGDLRNGGGGEKPTGGSPSSIKSKSKIRAPF